MDFLVRDSAPAPLAPESDLTLLAKKHNVKFFLVSFTDLKGGMRSKLVPAQFIGEVQKSGAAFAGFASNLGLCPADPDMFVFPDPSSFIPLPWKKEVAWVAGDVYLNGEPLAHSPRVVLKRLRDKAEEMGYGFDVGVECEFFLLDKSGKAISDPLDCQSKPCYDAASLMRRYEVIKSICESCNALGWGCYQNDHEDANGQFEINWTYADCLVTADRHAFFKFMVKSVAELHGYRASFMPKPFAHLTGSGLHAHANFYRGDKNLFRGKEVQSQDPKDALGLTPLAFDFIGGILEHAPTLCLFTNPTVNSYKRLNAAGTSSGSTWAPNLVCYGGNNRSVLIRVPDCNRVELRLGDGAANPYLFPAAILAAGLLGVQQHINPGPPVLTNIYQATAEERKKFKALPQNLLDAVRTTKANKAFVEMMGESVCEYMEEFAMKDWEEHCAFVSEWERKTTFDC